MYFWTTIAALASAYLLYQTPWVITAPYIGCVFIYRLIYSGSCILVFDRRARRKYLVEKESCLKEPTSENTSSRLEPYVYTRLPSERHIRLLKLQRPTRQTRQDNFVGIELIAVSLDRPKLLRSYRAISYTWDGQAPDQTIICDGKRLLVTKNCLDILRHAYRLQRLFVWIDAICIDQKNKVEKATQVPLMSEIYRESSIVNVWLGVPSYGDELCFHYAWLKWCIVTVAKRFQTGLNQRLHRFIEDRGHSKYIYQVLEKNWWRRVWTIQESVLTPSSWASGIHMNCGNYEMPLQCISGFLLDFCTFHRLFMQDRYFFNDSPWTAALTLHYPQRAITTTKGFSIHHLMYSLRVCGVQDERDRIYGLYGILRDAGIRLPKPSYYNSVEYIFWKSTVAMCSSLRSLELLEVTTGLVSTQNRRAVPSWVPNYSEPYRPGDFMRSPAATGDSRAVFEFTREERCIETYGMILDTIRVKSKLETWKPSLERSGFFMDNTTVNLGSNSEAEDTIGAYRNWYDITYECSKNGAYSSFREWGYAFGQILTAGGIDLLSSIPGGVDNIYSWILYLQRGSHRIEALEAAFQELKQAPEFDFDTKMRFTKCDELMTLWLLKTNRETARLTHTVWMMMRDKTVVSTAEGYIGSAHYSVEVGDVIALIPGVGRPMVLRPNGLPSEYEVVGPAFIEGMMKGERWDPYKVGAIHLV